MESKSSLVDTGTAIYVLILSSDCPGSIPGASTASARSGCRRAARLAEGCCGVDRCKRGAGGAGARGAAHVLRREGVDAACGEREGGRALRARVVGAPSARVGGRAFGARG